jgi:hypothetical protein
MGSTKQNNGVRIISNMKRLYTEYTNCSPSWRVSVNGVMMVMMIAVFVQRNTVIFVYSDAETEDSFGCDSNDVKSDTTDGVRRLYMVITVDTIVGLSNLPNPMINAPPTMIPSDTRVVRKIPKILFCVCHRKIELRKNNQFINNMIEMIIMDNKNLHMMKH